MCQRSLTLRISRAQISTMIQRSCILSFQTSSTKVRYSSQQYQRNSSPTIGLVENETKNFCVSDSTMHLKTPLKSPADGWGTEADFRNPFLLRSPESQYYNANVPRHLRWRGGLHSTRSIYLVLHSVQWHGETKINIISISNWATKFVWAQTRNILCLFYTNGTHT